VEVPLKVGSTVDTFRLVVGELIFTSAAGCSIDDWLGGSGVASVRIFEIVTVRQRKSEKYIIQVQNITISGLTSAYILPSTV
jgi:hypothetical protein